MYIMRQLSFVMVLLSAAVGGARAQADIDANECYVRFFRPNFVSKALVGAPPPCHAPFARTLLDTYTRLMGDQQHSTIARRANCKR